ncbi:MAG: amino acid ABC transporter permease [Chloroflexi bacterium]|nr:MAG: amino acid ABC transporter permease [Chloroflexota bacterium]
MLDKFVVEQERPRIEGSNVPFLIITDNQYRGTRPFTSWLRMFVGPGLDLIDMGVLVFVVFGAIGYGASIVINQNFPRPHPTNRRYAAQVWGLRLWGLFPFIMLILLLGTGTRLWGGLLLTFFLTVFGIAISFPIGVLAALGRRSHLPIVKIVSVLYIEIVRGVPLITVLFLANLMVPLIHPSLATVPGVLRVTVGIILFTGAYLAENVRGGLQAIPPGQEEAAKAVGLNNFQVTWYITLPQALRAVIPALVGMFISLYKDTSLVVIVGLIDLTGAANSVIAQTEFIGLRREAFLFISVIYFVFSYIMSIVSRRIEASGAGAATQRL